MNDLPHSETAEKTIDLPDVEPDTGHIIVHFLHTGQYQALRNGEEDSASSHSKSDFKKAIAALMAAKKYRLTGLQELAKDIITECVGEIGIAQVAHGIDKDTLAELQEDAGWLQNLVLRKIEQAFRENDEIFSSASFFNGIKSLKLAKLCGQHVAKLYRVQSREVDKELSELEKCIAKQGDLLKNWGVTEQIHEFAPATQSDQATIAEEAAPPLPPADEAPSDDWGDFAFTKKKKKMARLAAEEARLEEPEPVPEPVMEAAAVEEPEPVPEQAMEAPPVEDRPVAVPGYLGEVVETTVNSADVEDSWASFSIGLGKKKKKKGKKTAVVAEAPGPEPDVPRALEVSELSPAHVDFTSSNTVQEVPSVPPMEVMADVVSDPVTVVEDAPVVVGPPPANEQEDLWSRGVTFGSSKKKKKKRDKVEEELPPPPPPEFEEKIGDDFIEPETALQLKSESIPEPASLVDGNSYVVVAEEPDNDEKCPFRYEHLSQSDGWKGCQRCEVYMRKIAIKLHTAGLPDVNGLVAR